MPFNVCCCCCCFQAIDVGVTNAIDSSSQPSWFKAKCRQALRTFLDDIQQGKLQDVLPDPAAAAVRNLTRDMIHAAAQDLTTDGTAPALVSVPHFLTDEGSEDPIPASLNLLTWVPANSKPVHKPSAPIPTGCTAVSTEANSGSRPHFSVATCNAIGKALGLTTTTQHNTLTFIDLSPVNTQDATFFDVTRPSDSQQTMQVAQCRQQIFGIASQFTKSAGAVNLHGAPSPRRLFGRTAVTNIGSVCLVPDCEGYAVIHLQLDDAINAQLAAAGVNDVRSTLEQRGWGGVYFVIDTTPLNPTMAVFAAAPHISAAACAFSTLQNAAQPVLADSLVPFYFQALLRSKHNVLLQHHTAATPQFDLPACSALGLRTVATYAAQARLDVGIPNVLAAGWTIEQAIADPEGAWDATIAMNAQAAVALQQARLDVGIPSFLAADWTSSHAAADPEAADEASREQRSAAGTATLKARQDASLPVFMAKGWTAEAALADRQGAWAASSKARVENSKAAAAAAGKDVWSPAEEAILLACLTPAGDWRAGCGLRAHQIRPDLPRLNNYQINTKRQHHKRALRNKAASTAAAAAAAVAVGGAAVAGAGAAGAVGARAKRHKKKKVAAAAAAVAVGGAAVAGAGAAGAVGARAKRHKKC